MPLKTLEGFDTRPTQDIIKETLFNVIQMRVPGSRFLDLFAGSGAIGIEALSRGATEAYFVEINRKAVKVIEDNLGFTHLSDRAKVISGDVMIALNRIERTGVFGIIYLDPPYEKGLEKEVLKFLSSSKLISPDSLIIVEESKNSDLSYVEDLGYIIEKEKSYKHNRHLFIRRGDGEKEEK